MYRRDLHRILNQHCLATCKTVVPFHEDTEDRSPKAVARRKQRAAWHNACHRANKTAHLMWELIVKPTAE